MMNLQGSYTSLQKNSIAAMLAAIEIYNKPRMPYRDECFSILLINAWELLFKAILSKNRTRIYYPKIRNQPYRTLSMYDSLVRAKRFFPPEIPYEPVAENVNALVNYRNNAIHFHNQAGFGVIVYGLAQTNIINFRDLMFSVFKKDIANEMTLTLLPLGFRSAPDPIAFLQGAKANPPRNKAVAQFLKEVSQITADLESRKLDTSRFLTVFSISLQSVRKVSSADVMVGVKGLANDTEPLIIERRINPNISHPLHQKDIIQEVGSSIKGIMFSSFTIEAIIWKWDIKNKAHLFWRPDRGGVHQYSREFVAFIKGLTQNELETAIKDYKEHRRSIKKSTRTR